MSFLRNCWYMAGWSRDADGGPVGRTLLGEPIVFFRTGSGDAVALADTCAHRFAPLSKGKVIDASIQCPYHGLQFGRTGACSKNPHGPVTSKMSVRSYPLVERHRALWIWMGDPERADPALIRDLSFFDRAPDTAFGGDYLLGRGEYQLFVDNLLDLTHVDYLHPNTLGAGGTTSLSMPVVTQQPNGELVVMRESFDRPVIPALKPWFEDEVKRTDSWSEMTWTAPGTIVHFNGHVPVGRPRSEARLTQNVHCLTPETPTSTHYFFGATRNFALDDAKFNSYWSELRTRVFGTEDAPMIEAQQQRMNGRKLEELSPILLRTDEGNVRARRLLEKLIQAEAG